MIPFSGDATVQKKKRSKKKGPTYRRQKGKTGDRAFVVLGGRRHYLGEYDSDES